MYPPFTSGIKADVKDKAVILVIVIGLLVVVSLLIISVLMVSVSENFITYAKKRNTQALYAAEAEIQWAALKLRDNPFYRGGTSPPNVYQIQNAEEIKIKVESLGGGGYRVKAYVKLKPVLGKIAPRARIDATVVREVDPISGGIITRIKDWEEIRPPSDPFSS